MHLFTARSQRFKLLIKYLVEYAYQESTAVAMSNEDSSGRREGDREVPDLHKYWL